MPLHRAFSANQRKPSLLLSWKLPDGQVQGFHSTARRLSTVICGQIARLSGASDNRPVRLAPCSTRLHKIAPGRGVNCPQRPHFSTLLSFRRRLTSPCSEGDVDAAGGRHRPRQEARVVGSAQRQEGGRARRRRVSARWATGESVTLDERAIRRNLWSDWRTSSDAGSSSRASGRDMRLSTSR